MRWEINENNDLSCEYFPFIDGEIGQVDLDLTSSTLKLCIVRKDLHEICEFNFSGLKRSALEVWGNDIIAGLKIAFIDTLQKNKYSIWEILYKNYGSTNAQIFLKKIKSNIQITWLRISKAT